RKRDSGAELSKMISREAHPIAQRRECRIERIPLLSKEGWTRHQDKDAKPPLMERTGWLIHACGVAQPPLLEKEGILDSQPRCSFEVASLKSAPLRRCLLFEDLQDLPSFSKIGVVF